MTHSVVGAPDDAFAADRSAVQRALARICSDSLHEMPAAVADAMRYSLMGGGKRLRAILLIAAYRACGGEGDVTGLAAAVEVVHAYSLVHDDLPCMDDDDMRRGRPTVHRVFGVPVATAAGLAMVPLAVRCAAAASRSLGMAPARVGTIVRELMQAAGAAGMIGGQLLDLEGEGLALSVEQLERIHRAKTGALLTASVRLGGLAAAAEPATLQALSRYGAAIGLAFQIADDVLDVTSTTDELGKTAGRDVALRKSTYPALLGIEGATERARALVQDACRAVDQAGLLTQALDRLAQFTVVRRS